MSELGRVWLLTGDKAGDNAQVDRVGACLSGAVEHRRLTFLPQYRTGKPLFRPSIQHLDMARSDALEPPWPRLVLTSGRRPTMVALWIKQRSAGTTRIAVIGRPKRWLTRFDLVVAPAQYAVPPAGNVVNIELPLMQVDAGRLHAAATAWQTSLSAMPRPLIAVLIGGNTFPYRMDAGTVRALLDTAAGYAGPHGSLYVSTSRRTAPEAAHAATTHLPPDSRIFHWGDAAEANPYPALLAHADGFVVTGDSMSMITEVARAGRPLAIFALPRTTGLRARVAQTATALTESGPGLAGGTVLESLGIRLFPRELERLHRWLYRQRLAVPAGDPLPPDQTGVVLDQDLAVVVSRLTALRAGAGA